MDRIGLDRGVCLPDQNDDIVSGTRFFGCASRLKVSEGFDHALAVVGCRALPDSRFAIYSLAIYQPLANA